MGRKKVLVDKNQLIEQIKLAETNGPFSTRQELAIAVSRSNWALNNNITTSVVITRIEEFGITPLTQKGKRGRQVGEKLTDEHKQKLIDGRGKKEVDKVWLQEMRRITPSPYLQIVDKIEAGSMKSMIHLHCLECTNYNKGEIRSCQIKSCSLWQKRPYK